jgi:hypothetical protein
VKHTFVLHVTMEIGDVDPQELMGDIENDARYGGLDNYGEGEPVEIDCVDALEVVPS